MSQKDTMGSAFSECDSRECKTFHGYSRLPDELKQEIWKFATQNPAIHTFKLSLDSQMLEDPILVETLHKKFDKSMWRCWSGMLRVDNVCYETVRSRVGLRIKPKQDDIKSKDLGTNEVENCTDDRRRNFSVDCEALDARIDPSKDICNFKVHGDFTNLLRPFCIVPVAQTLFQGIQRISLTYKTDQLMMNSLKADPFLCRCARRPHRDLQLCPKALARLVDLFPDLKAFYLIVPATKQNLELYEPLCRSKRSRRFQGVVTKQKLHQSEERRQQKLGVNPYPQTIWEAVSRFRKLAKVKRLEIFEDSETKYYEVNDEDSRGYLACHAKLERMMDGLQSMLHKKLAVSLNQIKVVPPELKVLVGLSPQAVSRLKKGLKTEGFEGFD